MPDSQYELDIIVNDFENWLFTIVGSSTKVTCPILLQKNLYMN